MVASRAGFASVLDLFESEISMNLEIEPEVAAGIQASLSNFHELAQKAGYSESTLQLIEQYRDLFSQAIETWKEQMEAQHGSMGRLPN